jgi:hypothetical protein
MVAANGAGAGAGAGDAPVRRHTSAPMMRESEVRGKMVRFLAGMRAYKRQQDVSEHQQGLPAVLNEFIAWSGDFLASGEGSGSASTSSRSAATRSVRGFEDAARQYVGNGCAEGGGVAEDCAICLEGLTDTSTFDSLGEPVKTACGHRFHAVCFARHMEMSLQDVWCPMCRGTDLAIRFDAGN